MVRLVLTLTLASLASLTNAQVLVLPDGATGFGLSVGTGLTDDIADVAAGVTLTTSARSDIAVSYARAPLNDGLNAFGVGFAYYIQVEDAQRTAFTVTAQRVTGDRIDPLTVIAIGATAGRQLDAGDSILLIPSLSASVGAVIGSGIQTAAGVELLLSSSGSTRLYAGPSVSLNSNQAAYARGFDRLTVGMTAGVAFGSP